MPPGNPGRFTVWFAPTLDVARDAALNVLKMKPLSLDETRDACRVHRVFAKATNATTQALVMIIGAAGEDSDRSALNAWCTQARNSNDEAIYIALADEQAIEPPLR